MLKNSKWDGFIEYLIKEHGKYRIDWFKYNIECAVREYKSKKNHIEALPTILYFLSQVSLVYDKRIKRSWVPITGNEIMNFYGMGFMESVAVCLYHNLEILRTFFDINIPMNVFNGVDGFECTSDVKGKVMRWHSSFVVAFI